MSFPQTPSGERRHRIRLQGPSIATADPDGTYVSTPADLVPPEVQARITMATARERMFSDTIIATATHVIEMPYHPGVTMATQVLFEGRTFNVIDFRNHEERNIEMTLACVELRSPTTAAPAVAPTTPPE